MQRDFERDRIEIDYAMFSLFPFRQAGIRLPLLYLWRVIRLREHFCENAIIEAKTC